VLVESIVLAVIFGLLLGGRFKILEKINFKGLYFIFLSFLIEYLAGYIISRGNPIYSQWVIENTLIIQILVYVLLGAFFLSNFEFLGIKFIAAGSFLNFLVIVANRGLMPVKTDLAMMLGYYDSVKTLSTGAVFGHKAMEISQDVLLSLADIIDIPKPYFFPKTISAGDILIGFGAFFIIFLNMFYSNNNNHPI
jgi:hypothetical protein